MANSDDQGVFRYVLDANDRIRFVSDEWLDFARQNGAERLDRERVIEHSIWDFIVDARTRELYEKLFERARSYGQVLCVPFRCDSPDRRRFMELDLIGLEDGGVLIESRLLCEERREPVSFESLTRNGSPARMCSWCKRICSDDGSWVEIEEIEEVEAIGPDLGISHVTCPACYGRAREQLGMDC